MSALYLVPTIYWSLLHTGRLPEAAPRHALRLRRRPDDPFAGRELTEALHPAVFVNRSGTTEIYTFTIRPGAGAKPAAPAAPESSPVSAWSSRLGPRTVVPSGPAGSGAEAMESPEAFGGYRCLPDADARTIRDSWFSPAIWPPPTTTATFGCRAGWTT